MSQVSICPTCGSKSRIKDNEGERNYTALQDEEVIKKVGQLKKALEKFKMKAEALEKELNVLKQKNEFRTK